MALYPDNFIKKPYVKEMTHKEADEGKVNPLYGKTQRASLNCQACVVAYEMRRRGYDVSALPQSKVFKKNFWYALREPNSDQVRDFNFIGMSNPSDKVRARFLESNIESGKRYIVYLIWAGNRAAHVVNAWRNEKNEVVFYDPQTNKISTGMNSIKETYFNRLSQTHAHSMGIIRSDDLQIDQTHAKRAFK